jgi:adenylate cyclase
MADPLLRDALRLIQDIVLEEKGSALDSEAMRRLAAVLARLMSKDRAGQPDPGFSERDATVLFADLRGFSAISSSYPAQVVLGVLSRCFGLMTEIVLRHYGTIDKFMGDGIMVIFHGDNLLPRDHAQRALLCAVEMQIALNELRQRHHEDQLPDIYIGIGISSGKVMIGLIGSDAYRAFTAIGEHVNLAARIEALSLRGQVLMSETTYRHCPDFVQAAEPIDVHVKGSSQGIRIRELLAIPELGKVVPRQELRKSPRVPITLELHYSLVVGKAVEGESMRGFVRDIGYHGVLAEIDGPLPMYTELKLAFDLPCLAFRPTDIYARVVSMREQNGRNRAGLEFTSLGAASNEQIRLFVQMCVQGEVTERGERLEPGNAVPIAASQVAP